MNTAKIKMGRVARKEAVTAYLFILPLVAGLSLFFIYSFFMNIYISFTDKKSFGDPKLIGLRNYEKMFAADQFWQALGNTLKYVIICVPVVVVLSVIVAALLNSKIKGTGLYRTLLFLPAVTMPAAIGLLWRWLYNYEFGIINALLSKLGLEKIAWLSDPKYSLYAVAAVVIWAGISTRMIIVLAGLQGIPDVYYEAAKIDGANSRQLFFRITLPQLSPTIFFVTIMEVIGIFQVFDFIYLMIRPNSSGMPAARSLVSYFYTSAFERFDKGFAAATTVVLFLIILAVTAFQMKMQKKWVSYD